MPTGLVRRFYGNTGQDDGMARLAQLWLDELLAQASAQPAARFPAYARRLSVNPRQFGRYAEAYTLMGAAETAAHRLDDESTLSGVQHELATLHVTAATSTVPSTSTNRASPQMRNSATSKASPPPCTQWLMSTSPRGDLDRALDLYQQSLAIKEKLGDIQGKSATLSMMANVHAARQEWEQAEQLIKQSLAISQQLQDPQNTASSFDDFWNKSEIHSNLLLWEQKGTSKQNE